MAWTVSQLPATIDDVLSSASVEELAQAFGLEPGTLSPAPVARGRVGAIWRLDTPSSSWAVKTDDGEVSEAGVASSAGFQEAAVLAGVPAPRLRRTVDGLVYADVAGTAVRVLEWVDMAPPDPGIDAGAVGTLLGRLHGMPAGLPPGRPTKVEPWFTDPVGGQRWDEVVGALLRDRAPFGEDLAAHRDELVALESLMRPARSLRLCHRDLFCDNVRATPDGGLVVFDFDNAGACDPAWEQAFVLVEYATVEGSAGTVVDAGRVRDLRDAYRGAGGSTRLTEAADFTMVIAVLGHIAELASRRWLAARDREERADLAGWAAELTVRPLTRQVIEDLLDAYG